jgi:hypothetical protein
MERGMDMTYFQTFAWYEMLWNINSGIVNHRFDIGFALVEKKDCPIMIAPLWIVKQTFGKYNRKGFYLFGRGGWSDYLNFIYEDFDGLAFDFMLSQLKLKFRLCDFYFENVQETSELCKYIKTDCRVDSVSMQTCVGLSIDGLQLEEYKKLLSKQSRQNIRTANNRLVRDGKTFIYNFDDTNVNLNSFIDYRTVRVAKKNDWDGKTLKWRIIDFISRKILGRGWYKFPEYAPFTHDKASKFMTVKTPNDDLCAAFNYGISQNGRSIVLMGVSTNPEYAKYSPGILLLFNFIENVIDKNIYDYIDFTRGNESYKYALGGKDHYISHFTVRI